MEISLKEIIIMGVIFLILVIIEIIRDMIGKSPRKPSHYVILVIISIVATPFINIMISNFIPKDITDGLNNLVTNQPMSRQQEQKEEFVPVISNERNLNQINFAVGSFRKNGRLLVYSAPSKSSWYEKTSKGEPVYASTNDIVYVAGHENGWMLIRYQTGNSKNPGPDRMGYTQGNQGVSLNLNYYSGRITENCYLSDGASNIVYLKAGTTVTVLGKMDTGIYVESYASDGRTARGIVPERAVEW
ncbi:MAG: hypothetical protein IJQ62_13690 [Clostridia bacterium]|nr:hypothetical protein [Clostridia bacterium]